ncbi:MULTISPECIES: cytochrome aa3 quinol oxidase subunit IV [Brochothrix]|uniref:Quinol oxidase subunit 4 n=1 Tax=Brochothrix thermosphacta TaxID=2756 RepID=A0A1D2KLJ3_BROTH|nr:MULTISPECIES: cytochrome aa3 quinol oxidase subunit IV [Brochothrix]SLM93683.1 AA3-600 quinol oxidase subunit IV [Brachybacterium faecium]ANZ95133.1 cytochrome aa3 quinol oxidase subunit IV [Brochothrix thermosphacta]ANZ96562.1 cytochrome aa3 quinol oxidase subunit IV [Brochothrix thermosphacta]ATF25985.1 cytochrome aa3 quinol oxidase subunit IV [Brochothrix thermosphacta]ATH85325.1 cytochrome aa3 quinol oxidase subunit IV [Brochothrix thermosphacta]
MAEKTSAKSHSGFPWKHVIGFVLSIVLTLLAAVAAYSGLSVNIILVFIFIMAFVQAGIQLFMFMHVNEEDADHTQLGNFLFAAVIAVIIVIGSYWVMEMAHANHLM